MTEHRKPSLPLPPGGITFSTIEDAQRFFDAAMKERPEETIRRSVEPITGAETPEARALARQGRITAAEQQLGGPLARKPGTDKLAEGLPGIDVGEVYREHGAMQSLIESKRLAWLRFDMARSYPKIAPMMEKLIESFPTEEFRPIPGPAGDEEIAWFDRKTQQWKLVDSPEDTTWLDLPDIKGHIFNETTAGGVLGAVATKNAVAAVRMLGQFAGTFFGEATRLRAEEARGYSDATTSIMDEALSAGATAAMFEGFFAPVRFFGNVGTGRGFFRLSKPQSEAVARTQEISKQAREASREFTKQFRALETERALAVKKTPGARSVEEIDADIERTTRSLALTTEELHLTPGAVNPLFVRAENQAVATSAVAREVRTKQGAAALQDLHRLERAFAEEAKIDDATLLAVGNEITINYLRAIKQLPNVSSLVKEDPATGKMVKSGLSLGGYADALRSGRDTLESSLNAIRNRAYTVAKPEASGAIFDINRATGDGIAMSDRAGISKGGAIDYAKELREGILARGEVKITTTPPTPSVILDEYGVPFSTPGKIETRRLTVQIDKLKGELKGVVDELLSLEGAEGAAIGAPVHVSAHLKWSALELLQKSRTKLWEIKNTPVEGLPNTDINRKAGYLWSKLTDAISEPLPGTASPRFARLWRDAGQMNKTYHEIMDIVALAELVKTERPGQLALSFVQPGMAREITTLFNFASGEEAAAIRNGYRTILMNNPEQVFREVDRFANDREVLDIMLPEGVGIWKNMAASSVALKKPLEDLAGQLNTIETVAGKFLSGEKPNPAVVKGIIDAAGGHDAPFSRALGMYVIKNIADKSTAVIDGVRVLKPRDATREITRLDQAGILDAVFAPEMRRRLIDNGMMYSFIQDASDVGGIIAGSETGSKIFGGIGRILVAPFQAMMRLATGGVDVWRNYVVGAGLMSRTSSLLTLGTGKPKLGDTWVRGTFGALSNFRHDLEDQTGINAKASFRTMAEKVPDIAAKITAWGLDTFDSFQERVSEEREND